MKRILLMVIALLSFAQAHAQYNTMTPRKDYLDTFSTNGQSDTVSSALEVMKSHTTKIAIATPTRHIKHSSFLDRNKAISFNGGYNNSYVIGKRKHPDMHGLSGISVGISVYGVYINLATNTEGKHSANMGVDKYDGYNTDAYHIGYTLPITDWLSITPLVGYSRWQSGYYDGSDYYVDENGVHNKFNTEVSYSAFDYGAIVNFIIIKYINIYLCVTAANIGGGIGVRLPFDMFSSAYSY